MAKMRTVDIIDELARPIAHAFEKVEWDRLTVDQRHRARKAARAVFDRFGMSAGDAIHALQINAKEDK